MPLSGGGLQKFSFWPNGRKKSTTAVLRSAFLSSYQLCNYKYVYKAGPIGKPLHFFSSKKYKKDWKKLQPFDKYIEHKNTYYMRVNTRPLVNQPK